VLDVGIASIESRTNLGYQYDVSPSTVAVFVDPLSPGVKQRFLEVIDAVSDYPIDGIVFDRLRYTTHTAGMGPAMRAEFEKRYGEVSFWPESVFAPAWPPSPELSKGPRYSEWMQFRAEVITELLHDAVTRIRSKDREIAVGSYVGSGWETYYSVGVNYATDVPAAPYDFAFDTYGLAGYAALLDFLTPGCFYKVALEVDPGVQPGRQRFTVEGASELMTDLAGDATLVYPALYGLDWEGNPDGLRKAIRACLKNGDGIMFFDAIYVIRNDWWKIFEEEFSEAALAPHAMPSLQRKTRKQ
jgi:hypothetical protein